MSSQLTFSEIVHDARESVAPKYYPPFELIISENDGGVGVRIDRPNATDGNRIQVLIAFSPDDALRVAKALQEAAALARR